MDREKSAQVLSSLPILCNTMALLMGGQGGGATAGLGILRRWFGRAEDCAARAVGLRWLADVRRSDLFRRAERIASVLRNLSPTDRQFDFTLDLLNAIADTKRIGARTGGLPKAPTIRMLEYLIEQPITSPEEDNALRRIIKKAVTRLDFQEGSVLLFDETRKRLFFYLSVSPVADKLKGLRVPIANSIAGSILRTGQAAYIADVLESGQHYGAIDRKTGVRTESILGAPMRSGDRTVGVIELVNRKTQNPCGQDDIEAFMQAAQAAERRIEKIRICHAVCTAFLQCVDIIRRRKGAGLAETCRRWKMPTDARLAFQAALAVQQVAESGKDVSALCVKLLRGLRGLVGSRSIALPHLCGRYGKKA
ncbi:MAG: GAF domain-containing protein [Planctomycetota bacterium]